jgi:hypothetical protein
MLANIGTEFDEKSNNNYPVWNMGCWLGKGNNRNSFHSWKG